jgi:hypothetical protein
LLAEEQEVIAFIKKQGGRVTLNKTGQATKLSLNAETVVSINRQTEASGGIGRQHASRRRRRLGLPSKNAGLEKTHHLDDIAKLTLYPYFYTFVRDAFSQVGIMINAY